MRQLQAATFLAMLCLAPITSQAQAKKAKQAERNIAKIMTDFNEEMRGYERELKYFERVADFKPLFGLRNQLVTQAAQMTKLETAGRGSGPAVLELAREMDRTTRQLDAGTARLEKHAEAISNKDGRAAAERMKTHADTMVKTVDQLIAMFR